LTGTTERCASGAAEVPTLLPPPKSRTPRRAVAAFAALLAIALLLAVAAGRAAPAPPTPGASGIRPSTLAVVINTADPLSVQVGEYYSRRRHIPAANVARVSFDNQRSILPTTEFTALKAVIDAQLPHSIQAYALTWVRPYRVGCMSITAAFAFGFDQRYCASGCVSTQLSPYFDSSSTRPYDDLRLRPAMSIAAVNFEQARALIDRGVSADGSDPHGTAYLVVSGDPARDVRAAQYADARMLVGDRMPIAVVYEDTMHDRRDVMFYFIGATRVPGLDSNGFLPGAVADHLTSYGGALSGSSQMSALRWLEAGATGSYGTVVEPCNFTSKFPNTALMMRHYLAGETLIEAYWKSVAMPGQGLFIGEPLAAPFRVARHSD
jgi:uncharacterized protein (TIGR03790 family)